MLAGDMKVDFQLLNDEIQKQLQKENFTLKIVSVERNVSRRQIGTKACKTSRVSL